MGEMGGSASRAPLAAAFAAALAAMCAIMCAITPAAAAKATRMWNLTANTITSLKMAPTGTGQFGADQAKNDKDGAVDHDERLKIVGIATGSYDVRLVDAKGRDCLVKNVAVTEGDVFTIDEKQLTDCAK